MFKLMIAEDEAIERKALNFLLKKYYKDKIEVICQCQNGRETISNALKYRPNIILLDINMPIMGGLEAAEEIKKHLKDVEIIILTAFSYFEYAKKAIKLNVSEYLLKPISNDEFCNAIDNVIDKLSQTREIVYRQRELKNNLESMKPFLEKEIVAEMVYGYKIKKSKFQEYKRILNISHDEFMCIVFRRSDDQGFSEKLVNMVRSKLKFIFSEMVGYTFLDNIVFVIFGAKLEDKKTGLEFKDLLMEIQKRLSSDAQGLSIGVGKVKDDMTQLYDSYNEASIAADNKCEGISFYTEEIKNINCCSYPYDVENKIYGKLINEDIEGALKGFEEIMEYILKNKSDIQDIKKAIIYLCLTIERNIIYFFENTFEPFDMEVAESCLKNTRDVDEIRNYIKKLFKEIIYNICLQKKGRDKNIIEDVKSYIHHNYNKDLSLNDLAEYIQLSSYYLSKLFKKVEGINFKDYLIKVRMEKAKDLLRKDGKSIKETAIEVGYGDPNYFSRAFKKYVGINASEYKG